MGDVGEISQTEDPTYRRSSLEASGAMEGEETAGELEDLLYDQKQAEPVTNLPHEPSCLAPHLASRKFTVLPLKQ